MNYADWIPYCKKYRITYKKSPKLNPPIVERVLVTKDFDLNGTPYRKGEEIELTGHFLFRSKKRGVVKSIDKDPFIRTEKCVALRRFSHNGNIILPGNAIELSGGNLSTCLNVGKVRLWSAEIDEHS